MKSEAYHKTFGRNLKTEPASHFSGQLRKEILIHSQRPQVVKVTDGRR